MNQKNPNIKIIFFGAPNFAAYALQTLAESFQVVCAVTHPDKPAGRGMTITSTPVKRVALQNGIKVIEAGNNQELQKEILKYKPQLGIVFAHSEIISKKILDLFPSGVLNIHPSLLPKYRGASPVQSAIISGEKTSGVSIIKLDDKLDHGPILIQKEEEIEEDENAENLLGRLADIGTQMLVKIIPAYINGEVKLTEQDHSQATITEKLSKHDGLIDWNKTKEEIQRQHRAYFPWPGSFTFLSGKRIKILKIRIFEGKIKSDFTPGTIFKTSDGQISIFCKDGALTLEEIQPEGKKVMRSEEYLRGNRSIFNLNGVNDSRT